MLTTQCWAKSTHRGKRREWRGGGEVAQSTGKGHEWQLSVVASISAALGGAPGRKRTFQTTKQTKGAGAGSNSQSGLGPGARAVRVPAPGCQCAVGRRPALAVCSGLIGVSGLLAAPQQRPCNPTAPRHCWGTAARALPPSKQRGRRCVAAAAPGWGWRRCGACSSRRSGALQAERGGRLWGAQGACDRITHVTCATPCMPLGAHAHHNHTPRAPTHPTAAARRRASGRPRSARCPAGWQSQAPSRWALTSSRSRPGPWQTPACPPRRPQCCLRGRGGEQGAGGLRGSGCGPAQGTGWGRQRLKWRPQPAGTAELPLARAAGPPGAQQGGGGGGPAHPRASAAAASSRGRGR